ncbi:MAG: phosphoribosylanthranilate isomerase [Winogradskyella sp.]|uniref:phosphoribosylanthranilate isomerase n=1 Tax=Winogradskyella sp. TaxID=1883156 RepID=UPI0025E910BE|nr:phosphoribosylanthranilate isomerase [Winogradskyella sp.]NRB61070.1 phosphoribosylanthranilate isomerase [Winogradskyella sp.]
MKLKVCGMKYNIDEVAALQPDYLGFIFHKPSSRYFEGTIPELPKSIKKVGVFVNHSLEFVLEKINEHQLSCVQLHGDESPEYCDALSDVCDLELSDESYQNNLNKVQTEIIKVFSIKDKFNFDALKPYENVVDYFLFDTKGKLPGGNGYTFNWDVLKDYPSTKPYFLSGGIGLNELKNIKEFKKTSASKFCYALDVNSKFETKPGLKKIDELEKFKDEL